MERKFTSSIGTSTEGKPPAPDTTPRVWALWDEAEVAPGDDGWPALVGLFATVAAAEQHVVKSGRQLGQNLFISVEPLVGGGLASAREAGAWAPVAGDRWSPRGGRGLSVYIVRVEDSVVEVISEDGRTRSSLTLADFHPDLGSYRRAYRARDVDE